jgi:hypothetical protein
VPAGFGSNLFSSHLSPWKPGAPLMLLEIKKLFRSLDGWQTVRIGVLTIGGLQVAFWLYLFFYIAQHSNPKGDGMEWVAMAPATGILVMFVWPALQFGAKNELLFLAILLTLTAALINVVFFAEIAREFAESLPP